MNWKQRAGVACAIAALCLVATAAFDGYSFVLQFASGGSNVGTATNYANLNCGSGMSCSMSGSTFQMTATGSGGSVNGPGSSTTNDVATYGDTTGKNLVDSGTSILNGTVTTGGTAGSGVYTAKGTTSGSVSWACNPTTTCTSYQTSATVNIGKLGQINSVATAGSTGLAAVRAAPSVVTIGSGTSISATSLCGTAVCGAGLYKIHAYLEITTACTTTGTYFVSITYTDDVASKTAVMPLQGTGTTFTSGSTSAALTDSLDLSSTSHYAEGDLTVYTTGSAAIQYSTTAGACGTGGPMVGKMYLSTTSEN